MIEIELPDGSIAEFPDGTSDRTIEMALAKFRTPKKAAQRASFADVQSSVDSTEDRSGGYAGPLLAPSVMPERNAPSLSQINSANRAATASPEFIQRQASAEASQMQAKQRMYRDLPMPVRNLVGAGRAVGDAVMAAGQIVGVTDEADAARQRARDAYLDGDTATSLGNVGGQIAMAAIPMSRIGSLSRAGQYAASVGTGAAMGALTPTVEGESRVKNTLLGGALGGVGQGASNAVASAGRRASAAVAPEVRQLAAKAAQLGIRVTPSQLSNSTPLKAVRSTVGRLPFSGAQKVGQQQIEQFNRAVSRTFGEDAPAVNQVLYAKAKARIGNEFNRLSERNAVNVDDQLLGDLVAVQQEAAQFGADDTVKAVNSAIEKAISRSENGAIAGRAYQSMDSQLGKLMKSGGEKSHYIGQVRDALRAGMDRSISPVDQAAWQQARNQYRNLKTVRDLVAKETTDGISPAALMGRMNSTGAGREAMASMGGGDLADLARIGQRFLKDPIPNSGTAERLSVLGLLGGGGAAFGVGPAALATGIGGGAVTRGLLDSPVLARYMLSTGRGQGQQLLAPYLRPAFLPATGLLSEEGFDDPGYGP